MTTVFISGSRRLGRINDAVRERLDNITSRGFHIIVGDANGADKAMQSYLAENRYDQVTVYCSGKQCRNNLGHWNIKLVDVDKNLRGRAFYEKKDKEMAKHADFGFVLWDGKSSGSMSNALELLKSGKKVVIYFGPEKSFYNLGSFNDISALLDRCRPGDFQSLMKKITLENTPPQNTRKTQIDISFS